MKREKMFIENDNEAETSDWFIIIVYVLCINYPGLLI